MKPQNEIENETAFYLAALEKAATSVDSRTDTSTLSDRQRGNKILSSLLYSKTTRQEIHASMAALLILRGNFTSLSHPVTGVFIPSLLRTADNADDAEVEITAPINLLDEQVPIRTKHDLLRTYWSRPRELEMLSYTEVIEQYECKRDAFRPLSTSHVMSVRGKQLPNIDDCTDPDARESYFKAMNVLFKPHRQGTLKFDNETHEATYETFVAGSSRAAQIAQQYATNLHDGYTAARLRPQRSAEEILLSTHSAEAGLEVDDGRNADLESDDEEIPHLDDIMAVLPDLSTFRRLNNSNQLIAQDEILENTIKAAAAQAAETVSFRPSTSEPSSPFGEQHDNMSTGTSQFLLQFHTMETQIEKLSDTVAEPIYASASGSR